MTEKLSLTPCDDGYTLNLQGYSVCEICFSYAVHLKLTTADDLMEITIHAPFVLQHKEEVLRTGPGQLDSIANVLKLHMMNATALNCTEDGILTLRFESGHAIVVQPELDFEAWELREVLPAHADNALYIVCMPGGDLAIFQ